MAPTPFLSHAATYYEQECSIIPCGGSDGKRPLVRWKPFQVKPAPVSVVSAWMDIPAPVISINQSGSSTWFASSFATSTNATSQMLFGAEKNSNGFEALAAFENTRYHIQTDSNHTISVFNSAIPAGTLTLLGTKSADSLTGGKFDDWLFGGASNDLLNGAKGHDRLIGGADNDTLLGVNGDDTLFGGEGNDSLNGGSDNDQLYGGFGNDSLTGYNGQDNLLGEAGNDILKGEAGNDTVVGGKGADILTGGTGSDLFVLNGLSDSTPLTQDRIRDFEHGIDKIDLHAIDEITEFSQLKITYGAATTVIRDSHDLSHFSLKLDGNHALLESDFLFS